MSPLIRSTTIATILVTSFYSQMILGKRDILPFIAKINYSGTLFLTIKQHRELFVRKREVTILCIHTEPGLYQEQRLEQEQWWTTGLGPCPGSGAM